MFKDTLLSILERHELYISRCIQLALQGTYAAMPNPSVGAVVVHNGRIIGEGFTSPYGGPHAEPNAIASVKNQELLKESTLYVSLEPCSHFGKTPPCCDLVIEKQIPKVVIGTVDPFAKVCGRGIQKMRDAGVEVIVEVLEKECQESNKRFFTFHNKKRPYIILKWAESQDGFIAPITRDTHRPFWISNTYSKQLVHKWRSEEMAFLVGTQTVLSDNPSLTTRDWYGDSPIRVFLDRSGKIDHTFSIKAETVKTICITADQSLVSTENLVYEYADFTDNLLQQIIDILYKHNIMSVVIEGGTQTLQSFIDAKLWDEARIFTGETILGNGIAAPVLTEFDNAVKHRILDNELRIVYPK
ncbi:bifunctional diaminohydroxyphosphoribosylaminopyrimidine deaminase/5-amino-6-(5-phosphoribosylamino)uracil reductase RibD [Myroides marinus]|uniref:Riboflavin biosynthesis protein RibD n=1 Tax=Myroides marinus TaxID=703342 RepID=A0A1H6XEY0_9FLAO|nr:bifunctional diaminohydroxyphosphoribosylaminopyrimidine deaminase/5-amino-6-(5-phosphoribosylamino)uracil reductase RibD [Myroides marinus]KUF44250.1 bifunctional diaminohydroxyphosphoribosylaminopyrimidine deaminase/5-amino-6-(5-phosphoribosylamino)uracil reductase [Myroides marinus]MDM1346564.1 bifunctional diaminohydroxyphosphoribosylaminopyrimidine deaminase/5-amino-6-(5-phosphoribosylamino)uracil reductase RibD [Myroides marinus]MDM1349969.1 bifunctional diaminohydroxyphosphoribosylamin